MRRVPAGGRARPADNSAKSAKHRRSFGTTVLRQPSATPYPALARTGPGGPGEQARRSASSAPEFDGILERAGQVVAD
jgi:hypothetical protein